MDRIRHARRRLGLSQEELAEASGVSAATIVQVELGNRRPQGRTLRKLAAALGVEVADLLEEEAYPKAGRSSQDDAPTLEELHATAGCETDWLICPEARWQTAWPRDPRPREALQRVHETAAEFNKLKPLMAEQEQGLQPSQKAFGGAYQQAWRRFFATLQEAQARGVAAGIITDSETLYDLEERLGERPGHYLEDLLRAS